MKLSFIKTKLAIIVYKPEAVTLSLTGEKFVTCVQPLFYLYIMPQVAANRLFIAPYRDISFFLFVYPVIFR